jgi:hypothetical protein
MSRRRLSPFRSERLRQPARAHPRPRCCFFAATRYIRGCKHSAALLPAVRLAVVTRKVSEAATADTRPSAHLE